MENAVITAVLILILAGAVYGIVKRIRYGSACCGTKTPAEKKVKVKDKSTANYPYRYVLNVEGMHCSKCARRIENALNRTDGRWARADVEKKQVDLLSKHEEKENELSDAVSRAGYTLCGFTVI
ncbi:MAG: heavy-metal-associated domain-containing protein [Lachnospiraceae bacterium]|nr:heavy-metal-associated domain-containing protein [Lachnospiraceae bacterium]